MVIIFVIHIIVTQSVIKGIFDVFDRKKNGLELSLNGSPEQLFTKMAGFLYSIINRARGYTACYKRCSFVWQLLCHVLNRVTTRSGVFCSVISHSIQGLEVVLHYPIMAVTVGILIQLVMKSSEKRSGKNEQ